jgi:hypothetical protein
MDLKKLMEQCESLGRNNIQMRDTAVKPGTTTTAIYPGPPAAA